MFQQDVDSDKNDFMFKRGFEQVDYIPMRSSPSKSHDAAGV
jgi:hypothetical protein